MIDEELARRLVAAGREYLLWELDSHGDPMVLGFEETVDSNGLQDASLERQVSAYIDALDETFAQKPPRDRCEWRNRVENSYGWLADAIIEHVNPAPMDTPFDSSLDRTVLVELALHGRRYVLWALDAEQSAWKLSVQTAVRRFDLENADVAEQVDAYVEEIDSWFTSMQAVGQYDGWLEDAEASLGGIVDATVSPPEGLPR